MKNTIIAFAWLKLAAYFTAILVSIFTPFRFFYVLIFPLVFDIALHLLEGQLIRKSRKNGKTRVFLNLDEVKFPWFHSFVLIVFIVFMLVDYIDLKPVPFLLVFVLKIADHFFGSVDWAFIVNQKHIVFPSVWGKSFRIDDVNKVLIRAEDRLTFKTTTKEATKEVESNQMTEIIRYFNTIEHITVKDQRK